jgi:TP901 family phage tail tape measure protein
MADPIADLLVKVSADISGMQDAFNTAEGKLKSFGDSATAAGGGLMKLGAPLVGLGVLAAKTAGDFEASMNILGVAAGSGGASMEDLRATALKAGSDVSLVGVSASDVATAMTNFTKAGVSTGDMLGNMSGYLDGTAQMGGQLRAAIDLAAASELDLDGASRLVITTMATFGLSADDASAAMDTYVRAADASVMSVQDISDAMENVGPTMAQFGFTVLDTSTALALLSTRGITGAEAGTALKSMFTNLMRTTPAVVSTLESMNVSLYDQAGAMKPLPVILADLQRGMAGMTEEQRNQTIQTLAGTYGMKAMSTLLTEGTTGWSDMTTAIGSAASMQTSAAAQTKGFNASMENLKSTVEGFLINVGTPLINDVLTPLVQKFSEIISKLTEVNPKFLEIAIVVAGVVTAVGAALLIFGQLSSALAAIAPLIGAIGAPLLLIGAAVAVFALAWQNNWFGIRDTLTEVWTNTIKPILDAIPQLWRDMLAFFKSGDISDVFADLSDMFGEDFANAVADVVDWVQNKLIPALRDLATWFQTNIPVALAAVSDFWNTTLKPALSDLVDWLKVNIPPAIQAASDFWNEKLIPALQAVKDFWNNDLKPALSDLVAWLQTNIPAAINTAKEFWGNLKTAIGDVKTWIENLNTALGNILAPMNTIGTGAGKTLVDFFNTSLLPAITAVNNFIGTYLTPILSGLANVITAILGVAITALHGLWDKVLLPVLTTVWTFIKDKLSPIFTTLAGIFDKTLGPPLETVGGMFDKLGPALSPITGFLTSIATWLGNVADKLKILKLPDWLTPGSPTPFETALLGILDALRKVSGGPWDWFTKFTNWLGGSGGGTGGGVTINVTVAPGAVVVSGADPYAMGNLVGQAIARALQALINAENKYGPGAGWVLP